MNPSISSGAVTRLSKTGLYGVGAIIEFYFFESTDFALKSARS
jgi:hypothetical protein